MGLKGIKLCVYDPFIFIIRLVRLPQEVVALVSQEGLDKAARVRRLDMRRRGGRRDPKLAE